MAMAENPMPEDAPQRYAELERAYVEERWSSVLGHGQTLLELLATSDDPQAEDLANRVRVLLGHAHLYGLSEADVAEDYYSEVLSGNAGAELRRIATEGLRHCQRPAAPESSQPTGSGAAEAAGPRETPAAAAAPTEVAAPAAPKATEPKAEASPGTGATATVSDPFKAPVAAGGGQRSAAGPAMPWLERRADEAGTGTPQAEPVSRDQPQEPEPMPGALAPRLEVEVVEEPELVEVAQSDPGLAEELELELSRIRERRASERSGDPFNVATAAASPAEVSRDGNPVVAAPSPLSEASAAAVRTLEAAGPAFTAGDDDGAQGMEAAPATTASPTDAVARRELPAPDLSGEDPELVAGLLRVVLRD